MTHKTCVDWLRFRTQADPLSVLEAVRPLYGDMGQHIHLKTGERGILGFKQGAKLMLSDMVLGRMDFGGDAQRGWVRMDIPGKGCEWVKDWDSIDNLEALPSAEIRRLDVCLTTWEGEVSHERVLAAHTKGLFSSGGRPPALRQIISSDPRAGRTCEVGKREKADKFFRGYEKGFQLASKMPPPIASGCTHIDGHAIEGIYRCEVEFKAENRPIPWDVVDRRDHYFTGSYPFLAEVLPGVDPDILMRRPERAPQTELAVALANARIQYGSTLYTALRAYHGDITAVWDLICGDHHNEDLLAAGVLLVDHD